MRNARFILTLALCASFLLPAKAETWTTHFVYNNVTQIAMAPDLVYAISDGSLYSVNKQTEEIRVYNRQSGLHATGINCIHYDDLGNQLIICYSTGKIDLLSAQGVQYVGGLYDKDMTQRKTIYNITLKGRTAYLSTHYGVQTMDLRNNRLVDSYWLRPNGQETPIKDVTVTNDSIYAFSDDSLYSASLNSNLSDYTYWKREARSNRVTPDAEKGVHYQDAQNHWYRGHAEGIVRYTATSRLTYKPQGPLTNTPYRMRACGNRLGVVQGGYTVEANNRPGIVMILDNGVWTNYDETYMTTQLGMASIDYSDIIFEPNNPTHFFIASHGHGLIEFRQDAFYAHHNHLNSAIEGVGSTPNYPYIWVDGLRYDSNGNLWMLNVSPNGVKILQPNGNWISLTNFAFSSLDRSQDLLISVSNPNIKFISTIRRGIIAFDDNGTLSDQSDDRVVRYTDFVDSIGNSIILPRIASFFQTPSGVLLLGSYSGLYRIDNPESMLDGNNTCNAVTLSLPEEGQMDIFGAEYIRSITRDNYSRIWVGTKSAGVYCLSADLTQVLEHFSIDNSPMPSNDVLSLCYMEANNHLFIGTADGLVEYDLADLDEGLSDTGKEDSENLDQGSMLQWKLHFSYSNPQEVVATPKHIYAVANGSLFSVNRADESVTSWSKATGLNGSTVAHIAYDTSSGQLIIGYEDGRVDLLSEDGTVVQMPDIYMKAGSISVAIQDICVGPQHVYIAMPFGIVAINPRKAEVSDTYYIGFNASAIDIQQIVQLGDSLYAFSFDSLYCAALRDNLVDFHFWRSRHIPFTKVQQAAAFDDHLYALENNALYRCDGSTWTQVLPNKLEWIHVSNHQLLTYEQNKGLFRLMNDGTLSGLSSNYVAQDAIYSLGEYWLAEEDKGLVRLGANGDDFFQAEGPMNNFGYRLYIAHNQVYVAPGGRWATFFARQSGLSIFDGKQWKGIPWQDTWYYTDHNIRDVVSYAVDASDPGHFFAATYSTGVFEFRDYKAVQHYDSANSTLRRAAPNVDDYYYTCTDGAMMDENGNLWVLSPTSIGRPVNIMTPSGQWYGLPLRANGQYLQLTTPTGTWMDKRNSQYKWMICQRGEPQVILLNDGGTPTLSGDDRCMARKLFVDQNGNSISPAFFFSFAQDQKNRIWLGTDKGILIIPAEVDFFTSNSCHRIIIPRNDGTGLGDYLLGEEQIKCLAPDGGNRMWIGTANSGVYLIEDDTITVAHFTENNSLLPSNSIQSIAIMPTTGEVFVGTDKGIASYLSDASEPAEDMKNAYAFPNPVRPDYDGYISIIGLMDNTEVRIVDSGGNLVCKTRSHGGTAVWDGKNAYGKRATPGIYTALCNAVGGKAAVKILIIR